MDIEGGSLMLLMSGLGRGIGCRRIRCWSSFMRRYFWKQPGYRNLVPNAVQKMDDTGV
eukprot:FN603140.1.p2 GENE.FN603140.1~~FN603140.1.p2  ORF type:complete len:58 (+),score=9.55 FN603140.1:25-198(+)